MTEAEACTPKNKRKTRELWSPLRQVQHTTDCTNKTLQETFLCVQQFSGIHELVIVAEIASAVDKNLLTTSGVWRIRLDSCVGCHRYVFLPSEKRVFCPECRHLRFNVSKKPSEVNKHVVCC